MEESAASARYETSIAPAPMRLSQELGNTIGRASVPTGSDLLDDLSSAQRWLDDTVAAWCSFHGEPAPTITLTAADLDQLRALRSDLRVVLGAAPGPSARNRISAAATVSVGINSARLSPSGTGVAWLASAVGLECLLAVEHGELRRLKLCRSASCGVVFYDRSKNNSRVWHDVGRCGNAANVRAYRARQSRLLTGAPR